LILWLVNQETTTLAPEIQTLLHSQDLV
jgi:hypothetical protein